MNSGIRPSLVAAALALGAVIAAAQAVQAWAGLQRDPSRPALAATGTAVAVHLINGQVYYGEIAEHGPASLRLINVYYVQALPAQDGGAPANQLVNRAKADWHGPQWMSIPVDRIVFVEGIGQGSRLAELIAQEKKLAPAK